MSKDYKVYFLHIFDSIENIERFTKGKDKKKFFASKLVQDAVIRNLEIIGEAANRLPDEFKEKYRQVEWHKIVGLRHRIVHDYFGIDLEIIWQILHKDLPQFRDALSQIIG